MIATSSPTRSTGTIAADDVAHLISQQGNPAETLANIVRLIKERFETDVCSVYLIDYANLCPGLLDPARIESFFVPLRCKKCSFNLKPTTH